MYAAPLIIATVTGFLCIVAFAGTTGSLATKAFRVGPFVLIPPVMLWGVLSGMSCPRSECGELWRTLPLCGALTVAVAWHVTLIALEPPRGFYVAYAAIHLPAFYLLWTLALVFATNFPL